METLTQAALTSKQKAKLAEDAGWNPRISPRTLGSDNPAWRADWWERRTDGKPGYNHRQKQFPSRNELVAWVEAEQRKRAKQRKMVAMSERRGDSVVTLSHLTPSEKAALAQAIEIIRKAGGRVEAIADASETYAKHQLTGAKKTVAEIVAEHLDAIQLRRRPATVRDRRHNLKTFVEAYGDRLAAAITTADVERWVLASGNPPTQAARFRAVHALYGFAIKRRYLKENPAATVEPIEANPPDKVAILSAADAETIMRRAEQLEPQLVPYLAVGLFGGLRPENELRNLDWSFINLEAKLITVTRRTSKTSRVRHVPIQPNLAAWLNTVPEAKRKGTFHYYRRALRRVLGREQKKGAEKLDPVPWAQDIMRHSYASYRQAIIKNIHQLVEEMGNTPAVARAHYLNPPPEAEANRYWAIIPKGKKP